MKREQRGVGAMRRKQSGAEAIMREQRRGSREDLQFAPVLSPAFVPALSWFQSLVQPLPQSSLCSSLQFVSILSPAFISVHSSPAFVPVLSPAFISVHSSPAFVPVLSLFQSLVQPLFQSTPVQPLFQSTPVQPLFQSLVQPLSQSSLCSSLQLVPGLTSP
ncbi:hypothetical protein Pcinc_041515 [Petrolisthes cinctipes]|uniref:Uncharacterized protein n=1 Tax=Petrolisthes cinctipes TaxID=88211 RepID=A0AAE1BMD9_PETCI|nr:hypothetical protein Pcinc_041515 [Petrolisthes cinctipes]